MTVQDSLRQRIRRQTILFVYVSTGILVYLLVHHNDIGVSEGGGQQQEQGEGNSILPVLVQVVSSILLVICVEMIKILVSVGLYWMEDPQHTLVGFYFYSLPFWKSQLIQYMPIAILYAIYNNLMFFNLRSNLPTVLYRIITASRLLITAAAWHIYFKDGGILSLMRMLAIVLITLGIFTSRGIAEPNDTDVPLQEVSPYRHHNIGNAILIVFQTLCSVLADIYNEKLLKNDTCSQHLQNICLYLNSIAVNVILGAVIVSITRSNDEPFAMDLEINKLVSPTSSILIVLTLSMAGIMSSMVLRYTSSITKGVASASETVFTSLIEYFWFGRVYNIPEFLGILLVSTGIAVYSIHPSNHKITITRALKVSRRNLIGLCIFFYITTLFLGHTFYPTYVVKESQDHKVSFFFLDHNFLYQPQ
jgi:drug/metabolite transporter (DMT)-like permease